MDDSDLALDMAIERLEESSDIDENSQAGSAFSGGDGMNQLEVYTPSNGPSNPNPGCAARRGSYQNSGSEDSTSLSSFCTDSETGRRSMYYRSNGRISNNHRRGVMSDSETTRRRKGRYSGASLSMNHRVPEEDFFVRIKERLVAVTKDRDAMVMKARDLARQKGQSYDEIMSVEWYEHPEARKYLSVVEVEEGVTSLMVIDENGSSELMSNKEDEEGIDRPRSPRLTISPSEFATPRSAASDMEVSRIMSSSQHQLEEDARKLRIGGGSMTVMSSRSSKRSQRHPSNSSSMVSATSDSGVGDSWATSDMTPPSSNERLQEYIRCQSMLTNTLTSRDRDAQAAAVALISNSPHQDNLHPDPIHLARQQQQQQQQRHYQQQQQQRLDHHHHHHRQQQRVGGANMGHYSSGDDSSSVFTVTSQSSTSDLFIPKKAHHPMYNTDSEEPHHYGSMRMRRTLTTPKRSHGSHLKHGQSPSPLTEQQHRPRTAQGHHHQQQQQPPADMMLPPAQQPHPLNQGKNAASSIGGGSSAGDAAICSSGKPVHVIYHLDNIPTPFHAKWTDGVELTLGAFKDRVFARKGEYRFFFRSYNADLGEEFLETFTEDDSWLPVIKGKIVGRVEKLEFS